MNQTLEQLGIASLSNPERLELIGLLWDSITQTDPHPSVPREHLPELARRRAAAEADPGASVPWEEAKARLFAPLCAPPSSSDRKPNKT